MSELCSGVIHFAETGKIGSPTHLQNNRAQTTLNYYLGALGRIFVVLTQIKYTANDLWASVKNCHLALTVLGKLLKGRAFKHIDGKQKPAAISLTGFSTLSRNIGNFGGDVHYLSSGMLQAVLNRTLCSA